MARIGNRSELEAFVRAVELSSFSAAARDLKLTPSGVSKLVTRLERVLRTRLLHRTTRKVAPTPEGELFLERCRRVLAELEDAETEIGRSRERPRGRLRMHVGVGFAVHQVVPALPRFAAKYPEVQIDLLVEDRQAELVKEGLDLSVRPGPVTDTSLVARKLFGFERIVCASPAYLKRHGTPAVPADLLSHRCIVISGFPGRGQWPFRAGAGREILSIAPAMTVNNADSVLHLGLSGVGIVRLNEFIVADALRQGRLVPILADFREPEEVEMLAIYPHERHRLPRVAAMLEFLTETFSTRPWRRGSGGTLSTSSPRSAPSGRRARTRGA
ncbi:MAG: LysR family transcriptional regulator [Clostridia bacterium]